MNKITDKGLLALIAKYRASEASLETAAKTLAPAVDNMLDGFYGGLPKNCGMFDMRQGLYGHGNTLRSLTLCSPTVAAKRIGSVARDIAPTLNRLAFQKEHPEICERGEEILSELETFQAEIARLLANKAGVELELTNEFKTVRKQIADFWWKRREEAFTDINNALRPFCDDAKDLKDAAGVCTLPRQLFRRAAAFCPRYAAWQFNAERLEEDARALAVAIAALE